MKRLLVLAALLVACGPTPETAFEADCREAVDWTLTNPRDAEYGVSALAPDGSDGHVDLPGGRMWFARVDAVNSFGATVRHDFVCVKVNSEPLEVLTASEFVAREADLKRRLLH